MSRNEAVVRVELNSHPDHRFNAGSRLCRVGDEGLSWIRGWHTRESEEVAAMHAAYKLSDVDAMGQTGATGPIGPTGPPGLPLKSKRIYPTTPPRFYPTTITRSPR